MKNMSAISAYFSLCAIPWFTKKDKATKQREDFKKCDYNNRVFSSALIRTVFVIRTSACRRTG